jgi:hypothetical protein
MLFDDVENFLSKVSEDSVKEDSDVVEKVAGAESSSADLIDIVDEALAGSEDVVPSKVALAQLLVAGDVLASGRF